MDDDIRKRLERIEKRQRDTNGLLEQLIIRQNVKCTECAYRNECGDCRDMDWYCRADALRGKDKA